MVMAFNLKLRETPFRIIHDVSLPVAPEIPFKADLATVDRVKKMGGWAWYQTAGFCEKLNEQTLILFVLPFYLLGIIPVIVLIFAVLGKYKGMKQGSTKLDSDQL